MKDGRRYAAFTLLELLTVIAIVGLLAALALPMLKNFRKGDAMLAATRQMLGAVSRARQLAISQHTTVYMVFIGPDYWNNLTLAQRAAPATTNVADKQYTGYAYVTLRTIGDQPGRNVPRYLSSWQTLPDTIFIAPDKFNPLTATPAMQIFDPLAVGPPPVLFNIYGFDTNAVPFPTEDAPLANMPCIVFDYLGRLVSGRDEYIPLAHGSVLYEKDPITKIPQLRLPSVLENPPGNSTNISFNVIHIDWLTGRPRVERTQVR